MEAWVLDSEERNGELKMASCEAIRKGRSDGSGYMECLDVGEGFLSPEWL
jgi:hypothetical protein